MKSFSEYVRARGIEIPEGNIPGSWFSKHGYPMVVRCACCDMTMALPSAWIDEDGYTFCADCADVSEN
jgi:hypothetical protein